MKKNNLLVILVIVLIVINIVTVGVLLTKPNHGQFPPRKGGSPKEIIIERLHFDAKQIEQFHQLIEEHSSNIESLDKKRAIAKSLLYEELSKDSAQLDNLYADLGFIQEEIERTHIAHFKQIKEICNENQIPYFIELSKDFAMLFGRKPPRGSKPRR